MDVCAHCGRCYDLAGECCGDAAFEHPFPGERVLDGKYRLDRRVGKGGMGVVYRATHLGVERPVALKLILKDATNPVFVRRFQLEAKVLGRLEHPNIVNITDSGVDPRAIPYLVMQYLDGHDLLAHIHAFHPPPVERAVAILRDVAAAVDFAHAHGVLHRDLKASNVFLARGTDGAETVKVLDFGVARFFRDDDTNPAPLRLVRVSTSDETEELASGDSLDPEASTVPLSEQSTATMEEPEAGPPPSVHRTIVGTFTHMSPEILLHGKASRASDIYAFGVLAYELLTGALPFTGSRDDIAVGHTRGHPPALSSLDARIPPELDAVVAAALVKNPAHRPKSAMALVTAIETTLAAARERAWRVREIPRRRRMAAILTVILALASAAATRLPFLASAERRIDDLRFTVRPLRLADPRILLVMLDDATLARDETPLSSRADDFAHVAHQLLNHGASSVAIDFLLPQQWRQSTAFANLLIEHHDRLTLATFTTPEKAVIGGDCVPPVAATVLGAETGRLFGCVNLYPDNDGALRRAYLSFLDSEGNARPSLAWRVARSRETVAANERIDLDQSVDPLSVRSVSWGDLDGELRRNPRLAEGKVVIVGANYAGSGDQMHRVISKAAPVMVSGALVQALIVDAILRRFSMVNVPLFVSVAVFAVAAFFAAYFILTGRRIRPALIAAAAVTVGYIAIAFTLFFVATVTMTIVAPLLIMILTTAAAIVLRRELEPYPERPR